MKKFICTSDLHLRVSKPRCRPMDEDWMERQKSVLEQIVNHANKYNCPLYVLGDIFNTINDVDWALMNMAIGAFTSVKEGTFILVGNHDAKWKSLELLYQSPIGVLLQSVKHLREKENAYDFEEEKKSEKKSEWNKEQVELFIHRLVFESKKEMPIDGLGDTAQSLLEEFPGIKTIYAGDTHKGFIYKDKKGRRVVVPGCPIRQTADLLNYTPHILSVEGGEITEIVINDGAIVNDYLIQQAERESRVGVVIESLKNQSGFSLDFIENCHKALLEGELEGDVKKYILGKIG